MKTLSKKLLFILLMLPLSILAQSTLTGTVTDSSVGQPLPGVNIKIQGSNTGSSTDFSGAFTLPNLKNGDVITFTYLGFKEFTLNYAGQKTIVIAMEDESAKLNEVVVVGYGSVKKKDATGSIDLITSKDFNKGAIVSVDQLLTGKAAGVRITTNGGEPDSAPNIRIRGGSSISGQNNPLIVIDGVPLDIVNAAGNSNPLSLINPNDVDSFSILKDASASAIYGSRASNGVIIITTKKGKTGKPEFNFSSSVSIGSVQKQINVKSASEFTSFIQTKYPNYTNLLGVDDPNNTLVDNPLTPQIEGRILSNTNWVDLIYRESVSVDNNFSVRASLLKKVPFRASIGHTNNQGLVRTNDFERVTSLLKLSPVLLDNHLKIDINAKGSFSNKNAIDADGTFGSALNYDPTKPAYNANGTFYQEFIGNNLNGGTNPLAILNQRERPEKIRKFLGNAEFDYKMHFFPALRAVLNLGLEASKSSIEERYIGNALQSYQSIKSVYNPGLNYKEDQNITNKTMDAYLAYGKELTGILKKFDLQGGYSYQNFINDGHKNTFRYNKDSGLREEILNDPTNAYYKPLNLQSFFGRSNIDVAGKYLFTFSFRADASSLFQKDKRWGYFPAAAFAWKISDESLFKDSKFISSLKLRIGAGKTGQQDVTGSVGYFPTQPLFEAGSNSGQYLPGFNTYSALPFDPNITWEKTTTYNIGLDFDLFKNKIITGSVDLYQRKTNDLLALVPIAPGQGLKNEFIKNVGSTEGKGLETNLSIKVISNDNFDLDLKGNVAYNYTKITNLGDVTTIAAAESSIPNGTGAKLAKNTVGYQPYSAYVFEQIYGTNGKPIEGAFVDRNKDGAITDSDRYYKAIRPNWTFGFGLYANYKNLDFSSSFRGQKGGLVYNTKELIVGNVNHAAPGIVNSLNNVLSGDLLFNNNIGNTPFSDYFLQDASFIRCENITLGYKFGKAVKNGSLRIYVAANNLFVLTKYTGQDPENFNGIDNNFYPRPRVFSFGVNLNF
jgi:TonB-dependent starch-binding outer membrane protein SusC